MKKKEEKRIFAEDVAKKNQIWQHKISGEKFIVIKLNTFSIGLLPLDVEHVKRYEYLHGQVTKKGKTKKKTLKNWITVPATKINDEYEYKYTMVTA